MLVRVRGTEEGALQGHGGVDGDEAGNGADPKSHGARELLAGASLALDELLEGRVCCEAYGGVCPWTPASE